MAITATTLAASLNASDLNFKPTATTGATVGGFFKIDNEFGVVTAVANGWITGRRTGDYGSQVVAHNVLAPVVFGLTTDLTALGNTEVVPTPRMKADLLSIGANGAIACPDRDAIYVINKATALGSSTFANPTAAQNGLQVTFTSFSAAAHVVTLVTSNDGTTGNHTTYTFAAFKGASFTVVAVQGEWNVVSLNAVTVT